MESLKYFPNSIDLNDKLLLQFLPWDGVYLAVSSWFLSTTWTLSNLHQFHKVVVIAQEI